MSTNDFKYYFPVLKLQPTKEMFYSYVSEPIKPIGTVMVSCKNLNINHEARDLKLCVMEKAKGKQCPPNLGSLVMVEQFV